MRGRVELDSPDPLKPIPTGWDNTERIDSMNNYSSVLTEPGCLLGLARCFNQTVAYCYKNDSIGVTMHSHCFDWNKFKLMCPCKSSVFSAFAVLAYFAAVTALTNTLFTCNTVKVSTIMQSRTKLYTCWTRRLLCHQGVVVTHLLHLGRKAPEQMACRFE